MLICATSGVDWPSVHAAPSKCTNMGTVCRTNFSPFSKRAKSDPDSPKLSVDGVIRITFLGTDSQGGLVNT